MQTIPFAIVSDGVTSDLPVYVVDGLVVVKPISTAIGMSWPAQGVKLVALFGAVKVKLGKTYALAVTTEQLDLWLLSLPHKKVNLEVYRHICAHLSKTIELQSLDIKAQAAQHCAQVQAKRDEVVIVGEALDGIDIFRRAATLGSKRIHQDIINGTARRGRLDMFLVVDNMWTGGKEIVRETAKINKHTFSGNDFAARRKAGEIITGPEMQEIDPNNKALRHRVVEAHMSARLAPLPDDPHRGEMVYIGRKILPHSWEEDLNITPKEE